MARITLIAFVLMVMTLSMTVGQRPPYAGSRPIGYKDRFRPKPTGTGGGAVVGTANDIDNRFGELANNLDNSTNVTQRPPVGVDVVYGEPSDQFVATGQDQGTIDVVNRLGADQPLAGNDQQQQQQQQQQSQSPQQPQQTSSTSTAGSASLSSTSLSSSSSSPSSSTAQGNLENSSTDLFAGGDSRKPSIVSVSTAAPFNPRPTTVVPFRPTGLNHVPYDAHGDVFLVNLLNQRPVDQQPFWFVNYQAIEAHRNG